MKARGYEHVCAPKERVDGQSKFLSIASFERESSPKENMGELTWTNDQEEHWLKVKRKKRSGGKSSSTCIFEKK